MAIIDRQGVRIEYVSLAELQRWPRNPKGHDLGAIHESYDRFGYVMPMLLDERTGRLAVGHGRLDALQQRKASGGKAPGGIRASDGVWSAPVVRGVSFEDDGEMDAYVVADNRSTELGGWDDPLLAKVLADLAAGEDGLQGVGFDKDDLDALLASIMPEPVPDPGAQVDKAAELQEKWQVETGDLWEIGTHRLVCGDCTDREVVARVMGGEKADCIFTDPPYNVASNSRNYAADKSKAMSDLKNAEWDRDFDIKTTFPSLEAAMAKDCAVYVCTSQWLVQTIWEWMWSWSDFCSYCVYCKPNPMPSLSKRHWTWATELIAYAVRGKHISNFPANGHALNWWSIPKSKETEHPTEKPIAVVKRALEFSSNVGQIIFDGFLGSGTTAVACEQLHRRCFGIEIEPKYCAVTLERLSQMGLEPRQVE